MGRRGRGVASKVQRRHRTDQPAAPAAPSACLSCRSGCLRHLASPPWHRWPRTGGFSSAYKAPGCSCLLGSPPPPVDTLPLSSLNSRSGRLSARTTVDTVTRAPMRRWASSEGAAGARAARREVCISRGAHGAVPQAGQRYLGVLGSGWRAGERWGRRIWAHWTQHRQQVSVIAAPARPPLRYCATTGRPITGQRWCETTSSRSARSRMRGTRPSCRNS